MVDNTTRVVPAPSERLKLIGLAHAGLGHCGARRTVKLLMTKYWWHNMYNDTEAVVGACEACSRAKANFNHISPHLNPLPICGFCYRIGVDLAGPFPVTARGNQYAMVCIEHLSKAVMIVPIPNKEANTTASALLHNVLARLGAPAEVLTDQGTEWAAEFQQ